MTTRSYRYDALQSWLIRHRGRYLWQAKVVGEMLPLIEAWSVNGRLVLIRYGGLWEDGFDLFTTPPPDIYGVAATLADAERRVGITTTTDPSNQVQP